MLPYLAFSQEVLFDLFVGQSDSGWNFRVESKLVIYKNLTTGLTSLEDDLIFW